MREILDLVAKGQTIKRKDIDDNTMSLAEEIWHWHRQDVVADVSVKGRKEGTRSKNHQWELKGFSYIL